MLNNDEQQAMDKVTTIIDESHQISEKEKLQLLLQGDLIDYLRDQMKKDMSVNNLKEKALKVLFERIIEGEESEDVEKMSNSNLIRIAEILGRMENETVTPILAILKESQKTIINIKEPEGREKVKSSELTNDEIKKTKTLLGVYEVVENMKKTEFSKKELQTKKGD